MIKRLVSIYREIKTDYKKSRRLNDLPKVTQPEAGRPRTEGQSADPPRAPAPSELATCLIMESAWVRFTLISAGAFCLN